MSVSLQPSHTLGFRRPLTQVVKRNLTITNHNSQPVAFKVKTTAPKLYCVRPNSGRVEPGESCDVSVMLQALPEEPTLNAKCKDKFLIQSTTITPDKEALPLQAIWAQQAEAGEEGRVHQQKLRVTYLPVEGQTLEEEDETIYAKPSTGVYNEQPGEPRESHFDTVGQQLNGHPAPIPSAFRDQHPEEHDELHHEVRPHTPIEDNYMTRENSRQTVVPVSIPVPAPMPVPVPLTPEPPVHHELLPESRRHHEEEEEEEDEYVHHEPESVAPTATQDYQTAPSMAPTATHDYRDRDREQTVITVPIQPDPTAEILAKYHAAQAEIDRLRATIESMSEVPTTELTYRSGRGRRTYSDAGSTAETDVQTIIDDHRYPPPAEGVPLQVVVIIALGVFITTYLFF